MDHNWRTTWQCLVGIFSLCNFHRGKHMWSIILLSSFHKVNDLVDWLRLKCPLYPRCHGICQIITWGTYFLLRGKISSRRKCPKWNNSMEKKYCIIGYYRCHSIFGLLWILLQQNGKHHLRVICGNCLSLYQITRLQVKSVYTSWGTSCPLCVHHILM